MEENVLQRQMQQKQDHDWHAKQREFELGQKVMVKGRRPGSPSWVAGRIVGRTGSLTYLVDMGDVQWKCHVDQLKACSEPTEQESDTTDLDFEPAEEEESIPSQDLEEPKREQPPVSELSDDPSSALAKATPSRVVESTGNSELDTQEDASFVAPPHRYPLRDREKHRRF